MNAHIGWTRIGMRCAIGAAALVLLPFGAGVASAAGLTAGFDKPPPGSPPGTKTGYTAVITDLKPDDQCQITYGKNGAWNPNATGTGDGSNGGTVTFGPQDVDSQGYDAVRIHCVHKDGGLVFPDYVAAWDPQTHDIYSVQGGPNAAAAPAQPPAPAATPPDPLGTTWGFSDSGGAPQPWTGTWTRVGTSNTWNWTESNAGLPGSPTASGTATITYDAASGTVKIHRVVNGSSQTCDYVGTQTGTSITGLVTGFKGTVNCSNSGIPNMEWHTTSIQ